jgi:TRAP-type C4-dicarboxylate transport system permease small subunit
MLGFMRGVRPVLNQVSNAALYVAGFGMVVMTMIIGWQIFGRRVLNDTPTWSEPLSLHLMLWFILFGAAVGVRESVHLGLDIVRYIMPEPVQKLMDLTSLGFIVLFGIAMTWYSILLAAGTWSAPIPVLGWPGGVDFFPMIGGGILITLFSLERFVDVALDRRIAADVIIQEVA